MALIIKDERELDTYQRIDINSSFINKDGLYVTTIVYKDKFERLKEKERENLFQEFLYTVNGLMEKANELKDGSQEKEDMYRIYLHDILYVASQMENICYKNYYFPKIYEDNPGFQEPERVVLTEKELNNAILFGFRKEWYENPILMIRKDMINIDKYNKQDFTLESFYPILKTLYIKEDGSLSVIDDL